MGGNKQQPIYKSLYLWDFLRQLNKSKQFLLRNSDKLSKNDQFVVFDINAFYNRIIFKIHSKNTDGRYLLDTKSGYGVKCFVRKSFGIKTKTMFCLCFSTKTSFNKRSKYTQMSSTVRHCAKTLPKYKCLK